jgi:branched-chain amino acid transport system substrate-binding protein
MRRHTAVWLVSALSLLALALTVAACGSSGGSSGGKDITIGSIHPLTGDLAADGKQMDAAVKLAVADVNKKGGIKSLDGAKLKVDSKDSQGKPDTGQQAAQSLADEKVAGMIGTFQSDVTTNVATVAARSQVPLVIDVAVADDILNGQNKFVFRIQPNASSMGLFGAQSLSQLSKATGEPVKTVAYLRDQSDFGTSVKKAFQAEAQKLGIKVVQDVPYDPFNTTDFSTQLAKVKASHPDVLAVTGYYPDSLKIAQTATSQKPDIKAIYGVANGAYSLPDFPKAAGKAGENVFDSNYHLNSKDPEVQKIQAAFKEKTGQEMRTEAMLSYEAVRVLAKAMEDGKTSDPAKLKDAIAKVKIDKPLLTFPGPIQFDAKGENKNAQPSLMQVQNGKVVQVLPEKFAEGKPKYPGTPWSGGG